MDIVKGMEAFVAVAGSGSFVAAAERLDLSPAALSRLIAALEERLGVRLINRTTRRLSLTEAGTLFQERSTQILADLAEAEAVAGLQSVTPTGVLRISAPMSFGVTVLGRLLPAFLRRYPDLRLDIDLTDRIIDLAHDGVDVAIRIAQSPSLNLVARRIAPVSVLTCASPGYLASHPEPRHPSDLAAHSTLSYSYLSSGDSWTFTDAAGTPVTVAVHSCVHATNGDILCRLALDGGGIIAQPDFIVADHIASGRLTRLLPEWTLGNYSVFAVYLDRRLLSAKVRVFIDFLVASLGKRSQPPPVDIGGHGEG